MQPNFFCPSSMRQMETFKDEHFCRARIFCVAPGRVDSGLGFDAYYYGCCIRPRDLDNTVAQLKNLDFLNEDDTPFRVVSGGFEMRRYDYKLTPQGIEVVEQLRDKEEYKKIRESVQKIEAAGNPNYFELSIAAKAFFILRKQRRPMFVTGGD